MTKRDHIEAALKVAQTINHCARSHRAWRVRQWAQHIKNMLAEKPIKIRGQGRLV